MISKNLLTILSCQPNIYCRENGFKKKFPKEYNEILKINFPKNFKFSQKLYHYIHNDYDLKLGICKHCHNNRCFFISLFQGYRCYCCNKCAQSSTEIKQKVKNTLKKNYGVEVPLHSKDIKQKSEQTCQERYGCKNVFQNKKIQQKQQNTCQKRYGCKNVFQSEEIKEKSRQTCIYRYNVDNYAKTQECHQKMENTCQERYGKKFISSTTEWKKKIAQLSFKKWGVKSFLQTNEFKIKAYQTKKKNNSFHTSKIEEELYIWFMENNINALRQYKSDLYPFACDFYLPDYDLYIEIQGTWTHGGHPFDENNTEDIKKLNLWKSKNSNYYNNAIKIWTKRDVIKRNIANKNNLKYLEIFSINLSEISNIIHKYLI